MFISNSATKTKRDDIAFLIKILQNSFQIVFFMLDNLNDYWHYDHYET